MSLKKVNLQLINQKKSSFLRTTFTKFESRKHFSRWGRSLLFPVFIMVAFLLIIIPIVTYILFINDLATKDSVMNRNNTGVLLFDRHNKPLYSFYQATQKTLVPLQDIPQSLQKAVIAVEDREFYDHPGFSFRAIGSALYADLMQREFRYGGSTITQQLVKNALLSREKSFLRKYQEIVLAAEIERRFSKEEILEMYLNSVYFGEGAYGVADAAQVYYGKAVKDINLAESSLLSALIVAPSDLSPINGNRDKAFERFKFVLQKMTEQKFITTEEQKEAEKYQFAFKPKQAEPTSHATHFALMVKEELIDQFGEERIFRSGFKVYTSLDLDWQIYAEEQVARQVKNLARQKATNGAAVVQDPNSGEIRALVGSYNWNDSQFGKVNMATASRQPGSAFKPIVYIAGFESGLITPATLLHDQPTTIPMADGSQYQPVNFDLSFRGDVLVRRALSNSLNVPAVEVMQKVGVPKALEMAKRLGISTLKKPSDYGPSLVLGSGEVKLMELTNVYATLANGGSKYKQVLITKIDDKQGNRVFTNTTQSNRVLNSAHTFLISSILSDNQTRAEEFGSSLNISRLAAVKTGTTTDYKDSWTMGYTPSLTVGVWVGNNDGAPMEKVAGALGAAPIWKSLMEKYLIAKVENFQPPAEINQVDICRFNGQRLTSKIATFSAVKEYFVRGTEPTAICFIPTPTPEATPSAIEEVGENKGNRKEEKTGENGNSGKNGGRGKD